MTPYQQFNIFLISLAFVVATVYVAFKAADPQYRRDRDRYKEISCHQRQEIIELLKKLTDTN